MKFAYLIEAPFNYRDKTGSLLGHDVEVAKHVIQELGEEFEPIETEFAQLIPGVGASQWQMTTGIFTTEERRKLVLFSRPIWALSDGILVSAGNPLGLSGYKSIAAHDKAILAVIQDQLQHGSALDLGIPKERIIVFKSYNDAASAVRDGTAHAYASVYRAHSAFIKQNHEYKLNAIEVPVNEAPAAFGAFAFHKTDTALLARVDGILGSYLSSKTYRDMAKTHGFSEIDQDLVATN